MAHRSRCAIPKPAALATCSLLPRAASPYPLSTAQQCPQSPRTLAPPPRRATTSPPTSSPPAAPLPSPLLFILIALLLVFTAFAFIVTNRGAGSVVSGHGYREYRLGEYSTWLQRRVEDAGNWARIRSCLRDGSVCQRFGARGELFQQFVTNNLSPIQCANGYSWPAFSGSMPMYYTIVVWVW
ncbi:hypothetical protein ZWY2020_027030 [Hordeum vulgare]|nr:hypothetical protein ZWY2020_027030 [Hordeum vulgare]